MRTQLLCGLLFLAATLLEAKIKFPSPGKIFGDPTDAEGQCAPELPVSLKAVRTKSSSKAAMAALKGNYSTVIDFKFAVLDSFLQGFQVNLFAPNGTNCSKSLQAYLL